MYLEGATERAEYQILIRIFYPHPCFCSESAWHYSTIRALFAVSIKPLTKYLNTYWEFSYLLN